MIPVVTSLLLSVFILLMAPSFFNAFELVSPVVTQNDNSGLTLTLGTEEMVLSDSGPIKSFKRLPDGKFDLEEVRNVLADQSEDRIRLEPSGDLTYEEIVSVMDSIRLSKKENGYKILFSNLAK